jgi:hypothetical protein
MNRSGSQICVMIQVVSTEIYFALTESLKKIFVHNHMSPVVGLDITENPRSGYVLVVYLSPLRQIHV